MQASTVKRVAIYALWMFALLLSACDRPASDTTHAPAGTPSAPVPVSPSPSPPLVAAARAQIGVTLLYDPAYSRLTYPGGDVPLDRGVCTDVVIRAFRQRGLDLQQAVHEDMRSHFDAYPRTWGMRGPDRNIDHRRVPNLMRWFERQQWQQPASGSPTDFAAGDVVAWRLNDSGLLHIGLVSDAHAYGGAPLIIHNIGAGTQEDDLLFAHTIIGHYRPPARY